MPTLPTIIGRKGEEGINALTVTRNATSPRRIHLGQERRVRDLWSIGQPSVPIDGFWRTREICEVEAVGLPVVADAGELAGAKGGGVV